jgi:hypothetical protein
MLTASEKIEIAKIYSATCKQFDKILEPDVLKMQVEDLADLQFSKIIHALNDYRRDPKNLTWPRANKIRQIINPIASDETIANEVASRIRYAVPKFGYCNRNEAMEYIGEMGKAIVDRMGGWQYICENLGLALNPATFHAQCRDLAKSIQEQAKLGIYDQPIGISLQSKPVELNQTQNLILELANKKSMQEI